MENTEKTLLEWFELLPIELKEKAIEYSDGELTKKAPNLNMALKVGFVFKSTKEGHDFWWDISNKY